MPLLVLEVDDASDIPVMAEALHAEAARYRRAAELGSREVEAERRAKVDVRSAALRIVAALGRAATLDALAEQVAAATIGTDLAAALAAASQTPAGGGGGEAPPPAGSAPESQPSTTLVAAAAPVRAPIVLPDDPRAAETVRRLAAAQGVPVVEPGAAGPVIGEPTPEDDAAAVTL